MADLEKHTLSEKIDDSIDRAIGYLSRHQLHNGEFVAYMAPDPEMQEWCAPDSITGITAVIGSCLVPLQHREDVNNMLAKSVNFLTYNMFRGGVWGYYTKWNQLFKLLPPDTDDTVLISGFLKKRNALPVDNTPMLLLNRAKNGLFYTWFTIHNNFLQYSRTFWRLIARELKLPVKSILFWTMNDHRRNDIDVVVNANIVCYLGYNEITKPAVKFIRDVLVQHREKGSDKWYLNEIVYYSFLSRLFELDIPEMTAIRELFITKLFNAIKASDIFENCDLELALGISSLLRLGVKDEKVTQYLELLLSRQSKNGEWSRFELVSGPSRKLVWGSEETTTAYCIEALHLYRSQAASPGRN